MVIIGVNIDVEIVVLATVGRDRWENTSASIVVVIIGIVGCCCIHYLGLNGGRSGRNG